MRSRSKDRQDTTRLVALHSPISVGYRRRQRSWHCTALQFDIVGVGATRSEAFSEMRQLLADYLEEILASEGPVRFFNPSDAREWNVNDQEYYCITFILSEGGGAIPARHTLSNIRQFRKCHTAIRGIDLVPMGA